MKVEIMKLELKEREREQSKCMAAMQLHAMPAFLEPGTLDGRD